MASKTRRRRVSTGRLAPMKCVDSYLPLTAPVKVPIITGNRTAKKAVTEKSTRAEAAREVGSSTASPARHTPAEVLSRAERVNGAMPSAY